MLFPTIAARLASATLLGTLAFAAAGTGTAAAANRDLHASINIAATPSAAQIGPGGSFTDTFVISDPDNAGRDHHPNGYSMWLAGGGVKGGTTLGATDEMGFNITEDKVHIHDLQATILHQLGFDHTKLTFRHTGRDYRLTDLDGEVVRKILA